MKNILILILTFFFISAASSQVKSTDSDSLVVRKIFDEALLNGQSYGNLNYLCKFIGHRLSGSPRAEEAIIWAQTVLRKMPLDRIYLQDIEVPVWVRGDREWAAISEDIDINLNITSLGGSVATNGPMQGYVVEVKSIAEVDSMPARSLEGKIVFYNRPMDKTKISTFDAYGGCVDQRYWGAVSAAKKGAIAVLVRSMTTKVDNFPHTGSMGYDRNTIKIPAAALSTQDADILSSYINELGEAKVTMNLTCKSMGTAKSSNIIAEIKGSKNPEKIIVVGAHLDSWDKGEGAHDDGAGVVQCMEVVRIFKELGIKPKNTIRVVLFMNEENGNFGGKTYAAVAKEKNENHILALETDRGGFSPRGFSINGNASQIALIKRLKGLLEPYGLHYFEKGYGGVDINPLKDATNLVNKDLILMGLVPDSQRYFDYHHSADDVFENVNQRELELGGASMAAIIFLLDSILANISE